MDLVTALMTLFSGNLAPEDFKTFLHGAMQADFTAWSIKIAIVWFLMGSKVRSELAEVRASFAGIVADIRKDFTDHFGKVEIGLAAVAGEMKELKENVSTDLSKHSAILGDMKTDVTDLKTRVGKLETK